MTFNNVCKEMIKFDSNGKNNLLEDVVGTFYEVTKNHINPKFTEIIGTKLVYPNNEADKFEFVIVGLAVNFDRMNIINAGVEKKLVTYVFDDFTCQLKQEGEALINDGITKLEKGTKLDKEWRKSLSIYASDNNVLSKIYDKEKDDYIDFLLGIEGKVREFQC